MFRRSTLLAPLLIAVTATVLMLLPLGATASPQDPAPASPRAMTPRDVARVRTVGEVAISPNGASIAYTVSVQRDLEEDDNGPAFSRLRMIGFDGEDDRPFVSGEINVSHLRWTPDGRYLSYLARREGDEHTSIWAIPAVGGESMRVFAHDSGIAGFEWRADGHALAFVVTDAPDGALDALDDRGFNQEIYEEDFLARHVWTVDLPEGVGAEPGEPVVLDAIPGHPHHVAWSPDGARVVTDPAPTPLIDDRYMFRRLRIAAAESGVVEAAIENAGKLGAFRFADDGDSIVMISAADINDPSEGRLMIVTPETEAPSDLLPGLEGHVADFDILPDGRIVYLANVGVATRIGVVGANGDGNEILWEDDRIVIDAISLDAAGSHLALVAESPTMPREVFAMRAAGGANPTRLTRTNPWLDEVAFGQQEVVRWPAADGLEIEGILILPLGRADGQRVPTIVVAHGGPESHYKHGWLTGYSSPGHVAAGAGYAVFYPNYRGSTGRGVAFSKADQGDGVGAEFEDVVAGVDWLIESGIADHDRVGITGGSYGGYFTAWASTFHSDRFAAGVIFVGVSDQLSKTGTSDIANELELVHRLTTPYENLQLFLDRSPILYIDDAHTPLLILHGKDDPRVNPGQSRELHRALKLKGDVPVRLVLYPGEGHGNRRAAARYDYSLRMMRWFDHFLMNAGTEAPDWRLDYGLDDKGEE